MTTNQMAVSGYVAEAIDLDDVVERELRDNATKAELDLLHESPELWYTHLIHLKKKTEVQFTASRSRLAQTKADYQAARDDPRATDAEVAFKLTDFNKIQAREAQWRSKANYFLSRIEQRLVYVKGMLRVDND